MQMNNQKQKGKFAVSFGLFYIYQATPLLSTEITKTFGYTWIEKDSQFSYNTVCKNIYENTCRYYRYTKVIPKLIIINRSTKTPSQIFDKVLNSSLQPRATCKKAPSQMFDRVLILSWQPLMIFANKIISDVWQGSEYAPPNHATMNIRRLPIRSAGQKNFCN